MRKSNAFTMTELLIVIAIIVVILGLAVPAFNIIRGGKSQEAAANLASGMIARARTEAIGGVNQYVGVMWYRDGLGQSRVTLVRSREDAAAGPFPEVWLDLDTAGGSATDASFGAGIQFIDDCTVSSGQRLDDGYLGFSKVNTIAGSTPLKIQYGGVILFNRNGQIESRTVGLLSRYTVTGGFKYTPMGILLYEPSDVNVVLAAGDPHRNVMPSLATNPPNKQMKSSLGFVLYDQEAFESNGTADDPQFVNQPYGGDERGEEANFLDKDATPYIVNQYTGAVTKG